MKITPLKLDFDWAEIAVEKTDYDKVNRNLLVKMVFEIFLIREFERAVLKLAADGCIHGPVHASIGEEACAAGVMAALKPTDKIVSTHRAHHHYLSKIVSYYHGKSFNVPFEEVPQSIQQEVTCLMGEIMGLSIGCCSGRGGSMHLRNAKIGLIGTNAIVAGGIPLATGTAFASKYNQCGDVVVCFLGDGAVNQGAFHEAVNLAAIWRLPIIYFIENNVYAVATTTNDATVPVNLSVKAAAYGLRSRILDGMDPMAVMLGVQEAVDYARNTNSPTLIEAKCYRLVHHAGELPGSVFGYRTKEEEEQWQNRDPHRVFPQQLMIRNILSNERIDHIRIQAVQTVKQAVDSCTFHKDNKFFVKENLWPKVESVEMGIRSDGSEFEGVKFSEKEDFNDFELTRYVQAIASVTGRNLERDKSVFVLGEEIASFGGGPYAATKGLFAKYPDRVLNTPISECGFSGLAGGAAMSGLKPIVEIMYPDFVLVAADQLFNQIGKLRYVYGNTTDMSIVVRTRIAIGCGYGGQHSMDPAGLFSLFSGWRIIAPSNAFDYIGLFNSAMRSKDPVWIMEHHSLYPQKFEVPKGNLDYFVEMGKAKVVKSGSDVTIVTYLTTTRDALIAAEELAKMGIEIEIIDLRTLDYANIDFKTVGESVKKTSRLMIVEQAPRSASIGMKIADEVQRSYFDYLDAPVTCLSGKDIPNPVSQKLEAVIVPSVKEIVESARQLCTKKLTMPKKARRKIVESPVTDIKAKTGAVR